MDCSFGISFVDCILMTWTTCFGILVLLFIAETNGKWVRDVDSSIIEEIRQNPSNAYLIKFHAPWFVSSHFRQYLSIDDSVHLQVWPLSQV